MRSVEIDKALWESGTFTFPLDLYFFDRVDIRTQGPSNVYVSQLIHDKPTHFKAEKIGEERYRISWDEEGEQYLKYLSKHRNKVLR